MSLTNKKKKCSRFFTENSVFCVYLQGGEVVQETITSNIHDDIITLEFQRTDGTLITQLIDFRSVSIVNLFLLFLLFGFRKGQTPTLGPVLAPRNKLNLNVFIMIWMKVWIKFLFCFLLSSVFVDPRMKQRRKKKRFSGIVFIDCVSLKWIAAPCYRQVDKHGNNWKIKLKFSTGCE